MRNIAKLLHMMHIFLHKYNKRSKTELVNSRQKGGSISMNINDDIFDNYLKDRTFAFYAFIDKLPTHSCSLLTYIHENHSLIRSFLNQSCYFL